MPLSFNMKLIGTDYDEFTGITEEFYYEENALSPGRGRIHIKRYQDVEATLDNNKKLFNMAPTRYGNDGVHDVAEIPLIMIEHWKNEGRIDWFQSTHNERRKILNDREFSKFRTRGGRV